MIWRAIAYLLSRPAVVAWLIARAARTPYRHLRTPDGTQWYMFRFWLFNPYPEKRTDEHGQPIPDPRSKLMQALPSIRLHHIMRDDLDRDPHDHPWDARTIILRNWYNENREGRHFMRRPGDTATLRFGEYHRITAVPEGGVWTLFITGKYRGKWGYMVDGAKVPHDEYLGGEVV